MKFSLAIEKKNASNIGQVKGHNCREHPTASQLPKAAWLTPQGRHTLKRWAAPVLDQAKTLAKRKDAVLAIEMSVQVGNQTEWRDLPDEACPQGKPQRGNTARMNALMVGVRQAIEHEIGWDRVISAELHTDESTPHVQLVFAPILDGKLQAKHWVGGADKCGQLRARIWTHVNQHIACTYTKGAPGGAPHDAEKGAGKSMTEAASLKATIQKLEQQVQTLFSELKSAHKKALKVQAENNDFTLQVARRVQTLEAEIARLTSRAASRSDFGKEPSGPVALAADAAQAGERRPVRAGVGRRGPSV
jgi:outer membrane murein-binding lipoprotein Lpp